SGSKSGAKSAKGAARPTPGTEQTDGTAQLDGTAQADGTEPVVDPDDEVVADVTDLDDVEPDLVDDEEDIVDPHADTDGAKPGGQRQGKDGETDEFSWDEEEESEALKQARKDAELTASADSVRAYLKQIGKVALLNAEEEVNLAKRIEGGLYAVERMRQIAE